MRTRRFLRSCHGTSLVEFALVAPMLLFLLVGLIEVGRYEYYAILTANAARAGAQYGAQDLQTAYDDAGITSAVLQDAGNPPSWSTPGAITVNQLCAASGSAPGVCSTPWGSSPPQNTIYYVQVQVTSVYTSLFDYPGVPNSVPITNTTTQRVADQ
jgi:Flp pilus assembly protein TadG